ncbi:hypothetical protein [Streptococcus sp. OBRC6]|uniref:hypothetical protein n=1 Tax=Streptococcus sp. OBRC6 TaxID=936587 RepID=UPI0004492829|nr:hypothetical protein [Streptococcus sp. OBRC6]ETS95918.1 hypothetical protein HMPREF1512_1726 [Streptococcus sp. OBRC6]
MTNNFQKLRKYQEQADLSTLDKSIYVSIDRLTVLLDSQQSLRRIFRELRQSLDIYRISAFKKILGKILSLFTK